MSDKRIFFMVSKGGNDHLFTYAWGREDAKRNAYKWFGGNIEEYTVTPLTTPGDRIALDTIVIYA